jgi:hypothetical protein
MAVGLAALGIWGAQIATASAETRIADPLQAAGVQIGDCTQNDPNPMNNCSVNGAATAAQNGDDVLLKPGTFGTLGTVTVKTGVTMHGAGPGAGAHVMSSSDPAITLNSGAALRDVQLQIPSGDTFAALTVNAGSIVERVRVEGNGGTNVACNLSGGAILVRDTICYTPADNGRALEAGTGAGASVVTLRNVTAAGDTANGGNGVRALAAGASSMTMYLTNVIARGDNAGANRDVAAGNDGMAPVSIIADHSNYSNLTMSPAFCCTITNPFASGNGNTTTNPTFVDEPNGNFDQAPTSFPTINFGTSADVNGFGLGAFDYFGGARCTDGAPDIGADELAGTTCPTATIPTPPATTPTPPRKCKKGRKLKKGKCVRKKRKKK